MDGEELVMLDVGCWMLDVEREKQKQKQKEEEKEEEEEPRNPSQYSISS
jgi:hypothetical protein